MAEWCYDGDMMPVKKMYVVENERYYSKIKSARPSRRAVCVICCRGRSVRMGVRLNIIVAVSENSGIGKGGELPWKLRYVEY